MIRALVFDFDGLIADTEAPEYRAWQEVWAEHGHELTLDQWCAAIGTVDGFDALTELGRLVGEGFDAADANARRRARHRPLLDGLTALPGVAAHLEAARERGLPVAVASSSPPSWVAEHLATVGLSDAFASISAYDGSCPPKPAPDLYLAACRSLDVDPSEALAYEDSPNGIAAAKAAGLRCVAVPHDLTRHLDLSKADLIVSSLADITLGELLDRFG